MSSTFLYRGQVERLDREIAALERKRVDLAGRAIREHESALRATSSITSSTSPSTRSSKEREALRREKQAVDLEKRAADVLTDIGRKEASRRTAQANLQRALADERRREERELQRRREAERTHVRELERARLGAGALQLATESSVAARSRVAMRPAEFAYDVCLSFAGEDRAVVELVATELKRRQVKVFYDGFEAAGLWGKDLYEHLDLIYREKARYCVLFVSEHSASKSWPTHERRSAYARALEENVEYVLPVRLDDTEVPGLRPTVSYLDLREIAPMTLVEYIVDKLGMTER